MEVASELVQGSGGDDSKTPPGSHIRYRYGSFECRRYGSFRSSLYRNCGTRINGSLESHRCGNCRSFEGEKNDKNEGNCTSSRHGNYTDLESEETIETTGDFSFSRFGNCGTLERGKNFVEQGSDLCLELSTTGSCDFKTPPSNHLRCGYGNGEVLKIEQNLQRTADACLEHCSDKGHESENPGSNIRYAGYGVLSTEQRKGAYDCVEKCGKRSRDSETAVTYLKCRYGNDEVFNRDITKVQRKEGDECVFWDEKRSLGVDFSEFELIDPNEEIGGGCFLRWRRSQSAHCSNMENMKASNNLNDVHYNTVDGIRTDRTTENRKEINFTSPASVLRLTTDNFPVERKRTNISDTVQKSDVSLIRSTSRVLIDVTSKFKINSAPVVKQVQEKDIHRLCQRQKQIEYGKNTSGYECYIELVPMSKRKMKDPHTPDPKQICSKRSWDGQIRKWRRLLHDYDPLIEEGAEEPEDFCISKTIRKCEKQEDNAQISIRSQGENASNIDLERRVELSIYEDWMES